MNMERKGRPFTRMDATNIPPEEIAKMKAAAADEKTKPTPSNDRQKMPSSAAREIDLDLEGSAPTEAALTDREMELEALRRDIDRMQLKGANTPIKLSPRADSPNAITGKQRPEKPGAKGRKAA